MRTSEKILELAYEKLGEAEALLELICRRSNTCTTCPLQIKMELNGNGAALPGDGEERCLYHILSAEEGNGWNYGYKACHTCTNFHEGTCNLDKKGDAYGLVDECVACEDYEEDTNAR